MTSDDKGLLIAMVLGDAHLKQLREPHSGRKLPGVLELAHSETQRAYLQHKAALLRRILGRTQAINIRSYLSGPQGDRPTIRITVGHKYFRVLRRFLYRGSRIWMRPAVLQRLTPHAIALWYLDDGSLSYMKKAGKIHARQLWLHVCCSRPEAECVVSYFAEKWGISFRIVTRPCGCVLLCNTTEATKFIALIEPFVLPAMSYKIDLKYGHSQRPATQSEAELIR